MSDATFESKQAPNGRSDLRDRATKHDTSTELLDSVGPTPESFRKLVNDLEMHQVELEMQADQVRRAQMELEAERKRYFDLYQLAPVGYVTVDEAGVILQANLRATALFGINVGTLTGQKITRFISTEDQDAYYLHHKRLFKTTQPQALDLQMERQDGTNFIAQLTTTVVQSREGTPQCHIVLMDITERKKAESVQNFLAQTSSISLDEPFFNKLARFLAQTLGMDFVRIGRLAESGLTARSVVVWRDGHFAERANFALKGTPADKVVGKDVCCFPDSVCQSFPRDRLLKELRAKSYVGLTLYDHAGKPIGLISAISRRPLTNRQHAVDTLKTATVRIVTELQRLDAELLLRSTRMQLSAQQEASTDGILITDDNDRIVSYNNGFIAMWGISKLLVERRYRQPVLEFIASQMPDSAAFLTQVEHLNQHRDYTGRDDLVTIDGRIIDRYSAPILAPNRKFHGRVWYFRDISEHRKAEAERAKLHVQLSKAHEMECIGRLAGGVAHDFNNMLGAILGNTDMFLQTLPVNSPGRDSIVEIEKCAQRSAGLTRQLLAFARKQPVTPKIIDLNVTIEDMLKMLRRLIGEDIQLAWVPAPALWSVMVDPMQVSQILANLCVNARDAMSGGRISLETRNITIDEAYVTDHPAFAPGDYSMIIVSDEGCGMSKEVLAQIFEPFFTTKAPGVGTGLGLSTVYGIVQQNKGYIQVNSEPDHGTTFSIYLPRKTNEGKSTEAISTPLPTAQGRKTILLVEDEPSLLQIVKRMLERLGYAVLVASSAAMAIQLAKEHHAAIDLVLTDVVMPGMNGRELVKRMLPEFPGIKLLFMSGYTADVIALHGVIDEGVQFIQKPFTIPELAIKVHAAIASA